MEALIPIVGGLLIGVPTGVMIGAFFLRIAARLVAKSDVPFGRACLAVFAVLIVAVFIVGIFWIVVEATGRLHAVVILISGVAYFLVCSWVYGTMVTRPDTTKPVGFGDGMLVSLVLCLISVAIGLTLYAMFALLFR